MTSVFDNLWLSDLSPGVKRPKKKVATEKAEIPQLAYPKPWCDEAEFLRTIGDHKMVVLFDNGLMRHLRFSDGSFNRWFEIITWAGKLAISGVIIPKTTRSSRLTRRNRWRRITTEG